MRVARWRWVLVPMVVLVAGCLARSTAEIPADLATSFGSRATVTVLAPPPGATGQDVVAALRADNARRGLRGHGGDMFRGRGVPLFALVDCHGDPDCQPSPGGGVNGGSRTVWVVLYPDCAAGPGVGWAVVDAELSVGGGYSWVAPCAPNG